MCIRDRYDALYEAALCRERADWIVGINATRLFSTLYGQTLNAVSYTHLDVYKRQLYRIMTTKLNEVAQEKEA